MADGGDESSGRPDFAHAPGRYVKVNGARLWIETEGEGEPLVLIAGGPGASHTYMHGFAPLAKQCQLIYFDALGCGRSERPGSEADYNVERAVADLESLRIALELPTWNVLGHSYGGVVAQQYALAHPGSVRRLVLANTLISGEAWQSATSFANEQIRYQFPEVWDAVMALRKTGKLSSDAEHQRLMQISPSLVYYFDGSNVAKTVFEINMDVFFAFAGPDGDFHLSESLRRLDFRSGLGALTMPMLVLAGRYDRVVTPRFTLEYKRWAPQARFEMFEKSGHQPFVEEPEQAFAVLREFLGGARTAQE